MSVTSSAREHRYIRIIDTDFQLRKLKPLDEIDLDRDCDVTGNLTLRVRNWYINSAMVDRFGSGQSYKFKIYCIDRDKYTHIGDDGYHYHESWFESEEMFSEEDFLL
jgi:hypothetical protein